MTGPTPEVCDAGTAGTVGTAARVGGLGAVDVLVVRGLDADAEIDDGVGETVTTGVVLPAEDGVTVATWIGLTSARS